MLWLFLILKLDCLWVSIDFLDNNPHLFFLFQLLSILSKVVFKYTDFNSVATMVCAHVVVVDSIQNFTFFVQDDSGGDSGRGKGIALF